MSATLAPDAAPTEAQRRLSAAVVWVVVLVVGVAIVAYAFEPMVQQRQQRRLTASYRAAIDAATHQASGLAGVEVPTDAPAPGDAVAGLHIAGLGLEQIVVEGVSPSQTQSGPGHVPGTAGPGQPGNSVIVGRRATFGAPFAPLDHLEPGDEVVVTTTQGQSRYEVDDVRTQRLDDDAVTEVYGPSSDDRLTLVTSAGLGPWNTAEATVVVAKLDGQPFAPTPQGGRSRTQTGTAGDPSAWAAIALILLALGATATAAVWFARRLSGRLVFLLTGVPLIALTVLLAENLTRLLPGWV